MKKINYNTHYGLEQAVLERLKDMTRRAFPKKYRYEDFQYFELNDDDSILRAYYADGSFADIKLPYKIGETVAIAQAYRMITDEFRAHICIQLEKLPGWRNKLFVRADLMPHHIRITDVRVERLQDISDEDCLREGIWKAKNMGLNGVTYWYHGLVNSTFRTPRNAFATLIDRISGKGTWDSNPWVFAYTFELIK